MSRNQKARPLDRLKDYCNNATVHGMGYIFDDSYKIGEKLFWFLATIIMLISASKLINDLNLEWIHNPQELKVSTRTYDIEDIPAPAVTICSNHMPDRWGFLRNLLNLVRFECHSDSDCQSTNKIRSMFVNDYAQSGFEDPVGQPVNKPTKFPDDFVAYLAQCFEAKGYFNVFYPIGGSAYSKDVPLIDELAGLSTILKKLLEVKDYSYVFDIVKNKFAAKMNNNDLLAAIGMTFNSSSNVEYGYQDLWQDPLPLMTMMMMPMPGRFGTMAANFIREDPRNTMEYLPNWLYPVGPENQTVFGFFPPERKDKSHFLANIIDVMSKKKSINVSALDIGPIFAPVPNFNTPRKYSLQFRYTLANHWEKNGFSKSFLNESNYFGKLFKGNLPMIMEIMYHNMLKAEPVRKEWTRHPLYMNMKKMLPFTLNDTAFKPTLREDYARVGAYPYLPLRFDLSGEYDAYYFSKEDWSDSSRQPLASKGFVNPSDTRTIEEMDQELDSLRQKYYHRQMLLHCTGPDKVDCTSMFQPVVTDKGICYSLNALDFEQAMKNSTNYFNTFNGIFDPKSHGTDMGNLSSSYKIFIILNNGQSEIFDPQSGTFSISITNRHNFMGILDNEVTVSAGYHLDIKIDPHKCDSTIEFKSLSPEQRECRYHHEFDNSSIFMYYTRETCRFECRLKESLKRCGCTPWNYPMPDDDDTLCDGVGAFCFERAMKNSVNKSSCNCLQDCNELGYSKSHSRFKLNPDFECQDMPMVEYRRSRAAFKRDPDLEEDYDLATIVAEMIRNKEGEEFKFWAEKWLTLDTGDPYAVRDYYRSLYVKNNYIKYLNPELTKVRCKQLVETNFAFLTIELTGSSPQVCVKDISVTFLEKISMLGGTIGLFTGASLLSLVEAGFWILKIFAEFRHRR